MRIEVTQEHIDKGRRHCLRLCPIALALREATGRVWSVSFDCLRPHRGRFYSANLTRSFMLRFDAGKPCEPFSFDLEEIYHEQY